MSRRMKPMPHAERVGAEELLLILLLTLLGVMSNMAPGRQLLNDKLPEVKNSTALEKTVEAPKPHLAYLVIPAGGQSLSIHIEELEQALEGDPCAPDAHTRIADAFKKVVETQPDAPWEVRLQLHEHTPICAYVQIRTAFAELQKSSLLSSTPSFKLEVKSPTEENAPAGADTPPEGSRSPPSAPPQGQRNRQKNRSKK